MADNEHLKILRCALCEKPFNKESTLKRHGYYCRSRKGCSQPIRSRSCVACAKAKARCDNERNRCTRCTVKGIQCHYPGRSSARERLSANAADNMRGSKRAADDGHLEQSTEATQSSVNVDTMFSENDAALMNFDFADIGEGDLDWHTVDVEKPGMQILNHQEAYANATDLMTLVPIDQATSREDYEQYFGPISPVPSPPLPIMPTYDLRSFRKKSMTRGGANTTAMLMIRILTAYPMMMRDKASPPPFIHSSYMTNGLDCENRSYESLATCASLMQMLGSGGKRSRKLLWKNVRLECERFHAEWTTLDQWQLLASMQALLIYMILRLQEGETVHNNLDVPLLSAMWVVACALNHKIGNLQCALPTGLSYGTTQKDWIFEESRRRLNVVFRTIGMLFSTDPAGACVLFDGFLLAPLPARKQLWEARDENEWLREKSRDVGGPTTFGIKVGGQMVKLDESSDVRAIQKRLPAQPEESNESENSANWQEWCSTMDGLGALIMLAASLPIEI